MTEAEIVLTMFREGKEGVEGVVRVRATVRKKTSSAFAQRLD